jgi:DNA-binding winged helix-turn-helix (wHTH) protein/TolB-like protein
MNIQAQTFSIGEYRVESARYTVTGPEGNVHVGPELMGVLMVLVDHAGEVVTKTKVIDEVWPDEPYGTQLLSHSIAELRRIVGDDDRNQRYIESVPGRGYRLVAPVECSPIAAPPEPGNPLPRQSPLWRFLIELRHRKVCRAALLYAVVVWLVFQIAEVVFEALQFPPFALAFVVIAGALGFPIALVLAWAFEVTPNGLALDIPYANSAMKGNSARDNRWNYVLLAASLLISAQMLLATGSDVNADADDLEQMRTAESIVVIPFSAASVNLEAQAFAFALSEDIRHILLMEYGMEVISLDAKAELGQTYRNADLLLEGSVYYTRELTRVTVHLVHPHDGRDLWSDIVVLPSRNNNRRGDQIANDILKALPIGKDIIGSNEDSLIAWAADSPP